MNAAEITSIVGNILGVTPEDMRQIVRKDRSDRVVIARLAAITLITRKLNLTLTQVASFFGLKQHSTVIHAVESCENMIDTDRVFALLFASIDKCICKSEFERLQLTEFIPFIYTLATTSDE